MNQIFEFGSIEAIPLYNCSGLTPEEWSSRDGIKRPIAGSLSFAYGVFTNFMYIPILSVMFEKEHFKMSCFKIMIFLSIVDMLAIWINSIFTGWLAFHGAVYCTYPNFIYISGMAAMGSWCCSCITAMSLVINRLLDLTRPAVCEMFFMGNRTFFVLFLTVLYGSYFVLFTKPVCFTSKYLTWFFNPLIFEEKSREYANFSHGVNNILVVSVTCLLYSSLCCVLGEKFKMMDSGNGSKARKLSTQIFLQSALICAVNQIASIVYVIMNFIEVPLWLIHLGQSMWQFGHGAPVLIYLCLNKTIRDKLLKKFQATKVTSSHVGAIIRTG